MGIEILNSDLFCLILFTFLFKVARKIVIQDFSYFLFSSIQFSIKYNVLYEWSLSMIYWCALSFENVCEIYISDGERDGLEKTLASYVYK